jgi:hypothetical protein
VPSVAPCSTCYRTTQSQAFVGGIPRIPRMSPSMRRAPHAGPAVGGGGRDAGTSDRRLRITAPHRSLGRGFCRKERKKGATATSRILVVVFRVLSFLSAMGDLVPAGDAASVVNNESRQSHEYSYHYLFKSCFLAQIPDRRECKSLKHKHLVLTRSHKATESGRHFRVRLLRVLVPLCEYVFWLRPKAALGPFVPFVVKLLSVASLKFRIARNLCGPSRRLSSVRAGTGARPYRRPGRRAAGWSG